MLRSALALLLALVTTPALAQQQQTPETQALTNKLLQEISTGLQCQSALIGAQHELEELKKKHDEKPSVAAPPPAK